MLHFSATMKMLLVTLVAFLACVAAFPQGSSLYADVYRNILASETSRIVGGESAERHQFPYQASIRWKFMGLVGHICGGSLISERWVLTAGHCKAYPIGEYEVALGLLNQGESHEDVQIYKAAQFIVHPGYPGGAVVAANDIALIQLAAPVQQNDGVQVVPLAQSECSSIEDTLLSGWGLTSSWIPIPPTGLRWAKLPRISNEQCGDDLTALTGDKGPLDDTMICTTANEGEKQSACSGDSGGPLVLASSGKQVGVVSWGLAPCGADGAPSVYTSVCSHLDFINQHVNA